MTKQGKEALFIEVDISNEDQVTDMVQRVILQYGKIDILVNNAGITQNKKLEEIQLSEWERKAVSGNYFANPGAFD